jgi:hypothetical protein
MKYYVRKDATSEIEGPFELDVIRGSIARGRFTTEYEALEDHGQHPIRPFRNHPIWGSNVGPHVFQDYVSENAQLRRCLDQMKQSEKWTLLDEVFATPASFEQSPKEFLQAVRKRYNVSQNDAKDHQPYADALIFGRTAVVWGSGALVAVAGRTSLYTTSSDSPR